ncbi:MoxR family ATPase [Stieleria varia]
MKDGEPSEGVRIGDSRDGNFYRHDVRTRLALKVAIVTGRPLLMVGPPGCGKSSLAPYVARNLNFRLLTYTVTETAEASDLLWKIDYLKRLNDSQLGKQVGDIGDYIDQGVLWRAFQPKPEDMQPDKQGTLVLIDEIDKADSGFANSLLVAIGSMQFDVPALGSEAIKADSDTIVLVIMTSNEERELPPALTRRCVRLQVSFPTASELIEIASRHWPDWVLQSENREKLTSLADALACDGSLGSTRDSPVSTAEFLDLMQVLVQSDIELDSPNWKTIEGLVLLRESEEG